MNLRSLFAPAALAGLFAPLMAVANDAGPAYQLVLRSRHAEAVPNRTRDAQTGGGSIAVEQPDPNTVVVTMGGSAVAGSELHGSAAGITFQLDQDVEILAARRTARPPRVGMVGRVMGTLQVTPPGKGGKSCGSADQGPASAALTHGETSLLTVSVKPSGVGVGQESSINHRDGPVESPAVVGMYRLHGTFRIGVAQGYGMFHRQFAVADFDPAPQLDGFWADALKPFRAVPRNEFGFKIVLRVVEDAAAEAK